MKTLSDIKTRVLLETKHALNQAISHGESLHNWSLCYRETTSERDGGIMAIRNDVPKDWKVLCPLSNSLTPDEFVSKLYTENKLQRLPVLSIYK